LDMTYFVDFCLDSLMAALVKVENKINYLLKIENLVDHLGINFNQVSLLQRMALNKYKAINIEEYATIINKSREISRKELKDLLKKGLLKEEKRGKKFIYFVESKRLRKKVEIAS